MKKAAALITSVVTYLSTSALVLAQNDQVRNTKVTLGNFGVDPSQRSLGDVISNALRIVFIAAALAVLVYLIIGAFKWITSGGDKND